MAKAQKSKGNENKRIRPNRKRRPAQEEMKMKAKAWERQCDPMSDVRDALAKVKKDLKQAEMTLYKLVQRGVVGKQVGDAYRLKRMLVQAKRNLILQLQNS